MSITTKAMTLAEAQAIGAEFRGLFPADLSKRWEIAGSVRRRKSRINDIEHVVWPADSRRFWAAVDRQTVEPGLFADSSLPFARHVFDNGQERWGEKLRGIDYKGVLNEIYLADADNWGAILSIRTGPWDWSKEMVKRMLVGGRYRQQGGYVRRRDNDEIVSCPTEEMFFEFCRLKWIPPEMRTCQR